MRRLSTLILLVFSLLVLSAAIIYSLVPKTRTQALRPMIVKETPQTILRNARGSVDYYLRMHKAESDWRAIYSYEFWAGVDFRQSSLIHKEDRVVVPFPKVLSVDQEDDGRMTLVDKGDFDFNDELVPAEKAMLMLAKDYARSSDITSRSGRYLLESFSSLKPENNYVLDNAPAPEKKHVQLPFSSAALDYCPDLLSKEYEVVISGPEFSHVEIELRDKGETVIAFAHCTSTSNTYSSIMTNLRNKYSEELYYEITDPADPRGKAVFVCGSFAYIIIGNECYLCVSCVEGESLIRVLPYMIYLSLCLNESTNERMADYKAWKEQYEEVISDINKGRFSDARNRLDYMSKCQDGLESSDQEYLEALIAVLNDDEFIPETSDPDFNEDIYIYESIVVDNGRLAKDSKDERDRLIKYSGLLYDKDLKNYFLRNCDCTDHEFETYLIDLINDGYKLDSELLDIMPQDVFLKYMQNMLFNSFRSAYGESFTNEEIKKNYYSFKTSEDTGYDGVEMALRIYDGHPGKKYGNLRDIGQALEKSGFSLSKKENNPLFIVFAADKGLFTWDRTVFIFGRHIMGCVWNYDGLIKENVKYCLYEEVDISEKNKCKINEWYNSMDKDQYLMVRQLKEMHKTKDDRSFDKNISRSIKENLIKRVNRKINVRITYTPD